MNIEDLRQLNTKVGVRNTEENDFLTLQLWEMVCKEKHKNLDDTVERFDKNIDTLFTKVDQIPIDVGNKFDSVKQDFKESMTQVYLSQIGLLATIIGAIIFLVVKG